MLKRILSIIFLLLLVLYPTCSLQEDLDLSIAEIVSEYNSIIESKGLAQGIAYIESQYELQPDSAALAYCVGALKCEWNETQMCFAATEEAANYFERAYDLDPTAPENVWGQALSAYRRMEYDMALKLMLEFFSNLKVSYSTGEIVFDSAIDIISCADKFSTAAAIIIDCSARRSAGEAQYVMSIVDFACSLLNPHQFDTEIMVRGMCTLFFGVQYAKQKNNEELLRQYVQNYICYYEVIFRFMTMNPISSNMAADHLNKMYVLLNQCLDVFEGYTFAGQ